MLELTEAPLLTGATNSGESQISENIVTDGGNVGNGGNVGDGGFVFG